MIPRLVNTNFLNSIGNRNFILTEDVNNDKVIFDNDFFNTIIIILVISFFITFVLYTRHDLKNKNKKKNKKMLHDIINYCNLVKKTEYLKNLNNNR